MELNDFFDYKNQLMKDLCTNPKIIHLVTDKKNGKVPNHTLAYSQIFPYEFVPETVDDGLTFICFDTDIAEGANKTFYSPVLYIWLFTHKSKLRLPSGGVRTDKLASEINKVLDGSRYYGLGELNLAYVSRFAPNTDFLGRVLVYHAKEFSRGPSKQPPSIRKEPIKKGRVNGIPSL